MLGLTLIPPDAHSTAQFLLVGSLSAVLFSMAKSGFGGSIGILAVPLMVYACGSSEFALGLLLPMLIAADYVAVIIWWRKWDWTPVRRLMPGALVGIGLAWLALWLIKGADVEQHGKLADNVLKLLIGAIAVAFTVLQVVRWLRKRPLVVEPTWAKATALGVASGLTSTFAHAAGPIVAMYMLALGMPKGRYVASVAVVFWLINQAKLPAYVALGMIRYETLGATLLLVPAVAAGAAAGWLLHRRLGERQFLGAVYALLALAAVGLIWDAVAALG